MFGVTEKIFYDLKPVAKIKFEGATCSAESNFDILAAGYVDGENQALMLGIVLP